MAWVVAANLRGPKGDDGARGPEGPEGPAGPPGLSLEVSGTLADYGDLPANPKPGTAYIIGGLLYVADQSGWPADGAGVPFQGPEGPRGPEGPAGADGSDGRDGRDGVDGEDGSDGAAGADGADGADGERGSFWFYGNGAPGVIDGAKSQDMYLDVASGDVYSFS